MIEVLLLAWKRFRFGLGLVLAMALLLSFLWIRQFDLVKLYKEEANAVLAMKTESEAAIMAAPEQQKPYVKAEYDRKQSELFSSYEGKRSLLFTFCLKKPELVEPKAELPLCLDVYFLFQYWPMLAALGYILYRWLYVETFLHSAKPPHSFASEEHYLIVDLLVSAAFFWLLYRTLLLFNLRAAVSPKYAYFYLGVFFLLLWGGIVSLKQQYECLDNAPCPEGLHLHQQVVSLVKDFAARHKPGRSWTMAGSFAILASLLLPAMSCESKKVPLYGLLGFSREFDVNWQVVFCWLPFLAAVLLLFTGVKRQGRWRKVVYIISCLMFCAGAGYLAIFAVNGIVGFSQAKVPYQEIVGKVASEHGSGSTFGSSTEISNATFWSLWTFGVIVPLLLLLLRGWYPVRKLNMFLPERFKGFILGLFRLAISAAVVSAAAACMLQLGIMLWGMGVFLCAGGILLLGLVAQLNETRVQPGISREKTTV